MLGTPSYMAPEQAAADHEVGPRSDVYGLGAILYRLLVGKPPFYGDRLRDDPAGASTHEPVAPRQLNRAVDRDLETICMKCLQKEPDRRYATAKALAEDLAAGWPASRSWLGRWAEPSGCGAGAGATSWWRP